MGPQIPGVGDDAGGPSNCAKTPKSLRAFYERIRARRGMFRQSASGRATGWPANGDRHDESRRHSSSGRRLLAVPRLAEVTLWSGEQEIGTSLCGRVLHAPVPSAHVTAIWL